MARPINGTPQWLIDRMREEEQQEGVPEFLETFLRMKYEQEDMDRVYAGYEHERGEALWVNTALCSMEDARDALAELGIEAAEHEWCPNVLACGKEALQQAMQSELAQDGRVRVLKDPTALMAAQVAARAVDEIYAARDLAMQEAAEAEALEVEGGADADADPGSFEADVAADEVLTQAEEAAARYGEFDDECDEPAADEAESCAGDDGGEATDADADADAAPLDERTVRVAELCAGTGTMTLALSAKAGSKAHILACEVSAKECDQLNAALEAAQASNVDARRFDSRRFRSNQRFDVILLDPACSPTGTLYAHDPSLRSSFPDALVPECISLEKSLFLLALSMLEPGGVLVYTTTSVLDIENEEVIRTCLARSGSLGSFEVEGIELPFGQDLPVLPVDCEGALLTCPSAQCAGRFVAKIRRTA